MGNTVEQIDMKVLPDEAKQILIDFYLFLVKRYKTSNEKGIKKNKKETTKDLLPKKVRNFVPLKREEIYDCNSKPGDIKRDTLQLPVIKPEEQRRLLDSIPSKYQVGASGELIKIIEESRINTDRLDL